MVGTVLEKTAQDAGAMAASAAPAALDRHRPFAHGTTHPQDLMRHIGRRRHVRPDDVFDGLEHHVEAQAVHSLDQSRRFTRIAGLTQSGSGAPGALR